MSGAFFSKLQLVCALAPSFLPGWLVAQTQTYFVTELPVPAAGFVQGANNRHEYVGGTVASPESAILWTSPTTPTSLPLLGSGSALAWAINDAGEAVGVSASDPTHPHAALWRGGTVSDLGTLAGYRGSGAYAVNYAGIAAGYGVSQSAVDIANNAVTHAFLFSAGTVIDLGTLGGSSSVANGINSSGEVIGWSNTPSDFNQPTHATLWTGGLVKDLGTLGGTNSYASAINNEGVIVGEADLGIVSVANYPITHAARWKDGVTTDLGTLGNGTLSNAYAVNSSGDAVGISDTYPNIYDPRDAQHAVLWSKGQIIDLNSVLPAALQAEVVLEYAQTIADDGSIIAEARNQATPNCCLRLFLLTPVLASASLSTTLLSFSAQTVATTSAPQTVTLTNTGIAALALTSITVKGGEADDFILVKTCGASLAVNASCTLSVSFKPVAGGNKKATLSIDSANGLPQSVALSGSAIGGAAVTLSATSLSFASQSVGTASAFQTVTLTNTGATALTLKFLTVVGQADDFVLAKSCSASLAPNASCTLFVAFKPVSGGSKEGRISITDDASGSPQSVGLSGTATGGASLKLSATELIFPSQSVGTTSAAQTVTLTNDGNAALTIFHFTVMGEADDFNVGKTCGAMLAANASCTLSISFEPVSAGSKGARLSIADDASGSPQSVALSGGGV